MVSILFSPCLCPYCPLGVQKFQISKCAIVVCLRESAYSLQGVLCVLCIILRFEVLKVFLCESVSAHSFKTWMMFCLLHVSVSLLLLVWRSLCMCWIVFCTGHGEYSYQQPSYGDQGYDRSFDDSSQHYYEGGNILFFNGNLQTCMICIFFLCSQAVCMSPALTADTLPLTMFNRGCVPVFIHLQVTLSTVSSRLSTSRALASSSPSASSSTRLNKATADRHRDTVRANLYHVESYLQKHKTDEQTNWKYTLCHRSRTRWILPVFSVSAKSKPTVRIIPPLPGRPWSTNTEALRLRTGTSLNHWDWQTQRTILEEEILLNLSH